jgi:uncharacterized membrane protein
VVLILPCPDLQHVILGIWINAVSFYIIRRLSFSTTAANTQAAFINRNRFISTGPQAVGKKIIQEQRDILAIQTLRNWTMAATLLASTAILLGLGILNVAFITEKQPELSKLLNYFGYNNQVLWLLKLVILSGDFFFSFFNFVLAIRYYNHTGFIINVSEYQEAGITIEAVTEILQRGANHYTLGMRGYYFAIPLSLWLFGSLWLLGGTLLLLVILYRLDRFA